MLTLRSTTGVFTCAVLGLAAASVFADELTVDEYEAVLVPPGITAHGGQVPLPPAPWDGARDLPSGAVVAPLRAPIVPGPTSIRLAWMDPAGVGGTCAATAREEVTRLFEKAGIAVEWLAARETPQTTDTGEIRVIILDRPAGDGRYPVLGATPKGFERAPYIWVHLPGVLAVLGQAGRAPGSLDALSRRNLSLAVGRVIAHELVHALLPAVPHGAGLMSARLTARELTLQPVALPVPVTAQLTALLAGGTAAVVSNGGALRRPGPRS